MHAVPPRLLWCTDIHLDFLPPAGAHAFGQALGVEHPDARGLLLTGDLSTAPQLSAHLCELADGWARPIYFVLGNHDYYRGSFASVDAELAALDHPHLHWLRPEPVIWGATALVGSSGWYDGRFGDAYGSPVMVTDFELIHELATARIDRGRLLAVLRERADALAAGLRTQIVDACTRGVTTLFVATHMPPYQKAAWHEGRQSDDLWAPWFSSAATGQMLDEVAAQYPGCRFVVLCGHTHGAGFYQPHDNVVVYTGRAQYGAPDLAGIVDVGSGIVETL